MTPKQTASPLIGIMLSSTIMKFRYDPNKITKWQDAVEIESKSYHQAVTSTENAMFYYYSIYLVHNYLCWILDTTTAPNQNTALGSCFHSLE